MVVHRNRVDPLAPPPALPPKPPSWWASPAARRAALLIAGAALAALCPYVPWPAARAVCVAVSSLGPRLAPVTLPASPSPDAGAE